MDWITTLDDLHSHYGQPAEAATVKVTPHLTPAYRAWIDRARFCILTTVGPEGTDGSPRGDEGPVVTVLDPQTLALPDWHGNNRIDGLRNIVRDGRVSLMFLIPGALNALRINGTARLTADPTLRARFGRDGKQPRTIIVTQIAEVYSQCARADPLGPLDLWRPVARPAHRWRHAARNHGRPDRRQSLRRRLAGPGCADHVVKALQT